MEKEKRELAKLMNKLKKIKGSGTELISVYVPSGYAISEMTAKLKDEYGQAANIKSKTTRKNVQSALEKIIRYLKIFKGTPKNGLVVFCGNISEVAGRPDIQLFSISPPEPLQIQTYRCDSEFLFDPLVAMEGKREKYGLVVIDGKEAAIGVLEGNIRKVLKTVQTFGPTKSHKGGSSAARYQRFIEEKRESYYKRVGDLMDNLLFTNGIDKVIIGGPGPVKENFINMKPFNYQFKILGVVDIGYADETGIELLSDKAIEIIAEEKTIKEKRIIERFMKEISKDGLATYGVKEVMNAIESRKAEIVLLSSEFSLKKIIAECKEKHTTEAYIEEEKMNEFEKEQKCKTCGGGLTIIEEIDLFDEIYDKAEKNGIDVEIISAETKEGSQFLAGFKGIGAILKY